MAILKTLRRDQEGASLTEFAIAIPVVLTLILGSFDLMIGFWQWNQAMKALERGARIAAVSNPVASGMIAPVITAAGEPYGVDALQKIVCDGQTQTCTSSGAGASPGSISFSQTALDTIVYGRGANTCGSPSSLDNIGMCDIFPRITPQNVVIEYRQTGLGFQGRPGGPVPTITIRLKNIPLSFVFIGAMLNAQLNTTSTTVTAEDLSSTGT